MRAIRYTLAAALTVIAAASCQKEQPVQQERTITFTASLEQPETKVTLGDKVDNSYPVLWQKDDQLTVFDDGAVNKKFSHSETTASKSVTFTGTGNFTDGNSYVAIYPYHRNHTYADNTISWSGSGTKQQYPNTASSNLPMEKNGRSLAIVAAKGIIEKEGTDLSFSNVMAMVKFTLTESGKLTRVRLVNNATSDNNFCIDGNLSISASDFSVTGDANLIQFYPLKGQEGTATFDAGTYYIAVHPGAIIPEIKFDSGKNTQVTYKKGTKEVTLKAGEILDLGSFTMPQATE